MTCGASSLPTQATQAAYVRGGIHRVLPRLQWYTHFALLHLPTLLCCVQPSHIMSCCGSLLNLGCKSTQHSHDTPQAAGTCAAMGATGSAAGTVPRAPSKRRQAPPSSAQAAARWQAQVVAPPSQLVCGGAAWLVAAGTRASRRLQGQRQATCKILIILISTNEQRHAITDNLYTSVQLLWEQLRCGTSRFVGHVLVGCLLLTSCPGCWQ